MQLFLVVRARQLDSLAQLVGALRWNRRAACRFNMDLLPNEQNFDPDKSRQKIHHSLKEHHKVFSHFVLRTRN